MEEVILRSDGARVALKREPRNEESRPKDAYAGSSFTVELQAPGLDVSRDVFMFDFAWAALLGFFEDLAESWRGWVGEKEWISSEYDLSIRAEADSLGHCALTWSVQAGPVPGWRATIVGFDVALGEEMKVLARSIDEWIVKV